MLTAAVIVFVLAYAAITLEKPLKINKSAFFSIGAGFVWTGRALSSNDAHLTSEDLSKSLMSTVQIGLS